MQPNVEECGPCPIFASYTPEFALQLRKKNEKTSVMIRKTSVRLRKNLRVQYANYQKHPHITKPSRIHRLDKLKAKTENTI
jgi:hypothetical protein